ncbi:DUF1080 domain-containing protein [Akkermansiaceae bacterium]|nr:DUF1080 domain-containing protein [Akkermansiaceae bacterium]MDA8967355.1 DUF1080 domain-containing protein [Akkermansiaceae bacterium]MDA8980582.1 DUF1080 domain-containing protein [bacterium]MDB4294848.1 DUF1080 domain-containing protein [Akkermansiaceae bacterium]MDB4451930.1 DUF1080 domain-containing protein [Akkermansiaceae bacterium]
MKQFLLVALALTTPLFGQETKQKPAPNPIADFSPGSLKKDGFVGLIKGDTLDGWNIKGSKANFSVKDGEIMGSATNLKGNSFLCSDKIYGDFIYTFQFKFDHLKGNSGCMFRGLVNEKGRVNGYQCEGDNTPRSWTAGLFDEARRGWLFPSRPKKPQGLTPEQQADAKKQQAAFTEQGLKITKMTEWNQITVKCVGNHLQTWLNGELRVDFKDTDPEHTTPEGFFGLQVHGGPSCDVRWRNIFVKELK